MPWGYSCHLDISRCDKRIEVFFPYAVFTESARNTLRHFIIALVEHIKMKRYGDPVIEYFGTEEAKGWSVMQLIETSCITMHTTDESSNIYLDVFSCRKFEPEDVIDFVRSYWSPQKIMYNYIERDAGEEDRKENQSVPASYCED